MYAHRYQLRLIYGAILLVFLVWLASEMFYTGTRVPPRAPERDVCVVGSAEVAPCPS